MASSIVAGSESVFDFYCELCVQDGEMRKACGFCVNCEDYLCQDCFSIHKKTRPTKHHEVLDETNMPRDTPLSGDRARKYISSTCSQHRGKHIEFYCKSHEFLGCSTCIITNHRRCDHVESVVDGASNIIESKEYGDFVQKLQNLQQRSSHMISKSHDNKSDVETCLSTAIETIRNFRKQINHLLDKQEERLRLEAEKIKEEECESIKSNVIQLISLKEKVGKITLEMKELEREKKLCELYITMNKYKQQVTGIEASLTEVEKTEIRNYCFKPNQQLQVTIDKRSSFGTISINLRRASPYPNRQQSTLHRTSGQASGSSQFGQASSHLPTRKPVHVPSLRSNNTMIVPDWYGASDTSYTQEYSSEQRQLAQISQSEQTAPNLQSNPNNGTPSQTNYAIKTSSADFDEFDYDDGNYYQDYDCYNDFSDDFYN